jgi:hypothetical protein
MFGALTSLLGGTGGGDTDYTSWGGQSLMYDQSGKPVGFTSDNTPMLLRWMTGGSTPDSLNLPQVESFSTGGNTYTPRSGGSRPPRGGGSGNGGGTPGGGTSPPPPPAPPPVNPGIPPWAFPQYTQTWAFTPPTPFYTPPPPVFNKANYPETPVTPVKK